jgi:hypothetical protein
MSCSPGRSLSVGSKRLGWKSEHAQVTVDAIKQVIEAARTGQPLAR